MTSEQARELFSAAVESELDAATRAEFESALLADAELGREYASFGALIARTRPAGASAQHARDLLPGVQRRLRERSAGRFYADRFAERLASGRVQPWALGLIMLGVLALFWLGVSWFEGATLMPHEPP